MYTSLCSPLQIAPMKNELAELPCVHKVVSNVLTEQTETFQKYVCGMPLTFLSQMFYKTQISTAPLTSTLLLIVCPPK